MVLKWARLPVLLAALGISVMLSGCSSLTGFYFYPKQTWLQTPENMGIAYQDVYLETEDGTQVHGWWMNGLLDSRGLSNRASGVGKEESPMVLFLHGNGENISTHIRAIGWLVYRGVDVFALDYRGYGASNGAALLPAVLQDVEAAARWLRGRYPDRPLVLLGQSFGGGLAIIFGHEASDQYGISAVVVESAPYSYARAAREILANSVIGWVVWPFAWLLPTAWDPQQFTGDYPLPVLLLHSPEDEVVRYRHGRDLYRSLQPNACWQETSGPHASGFSESKVRDRVLQFIKKQQC